MLSGQLIKVSACKGHGLAEGSHHSVNWCVGGVLGCLWHFVFGHVLLYMSVFVHCLTIVSVRQSIIIIIIVWGRGQRKGDLAHIIKFFQEGEVEPLVDYNDDYVIYSAWQTARSNARSLHKLYTNTL